MGNAALQTKKEKQKKKEKTAMLKIEIYADPNLFPTLRTVINEIGNFVIVVEDAATLSREVNLKATNRHAIDKNFCLKKKLTVLCNTYTIGQEVQNAVQELLDKETQTMGVIVVSRVQDIIVSKQSKDLKS